MNLKNELMLISALQYANNETLDKSLELLRNHVAANDFDTEQLLHLTADGQWAWYNDQTHGAKLDTYLAEAHRLGIREIMYLNIHCFSLEVAAIHPDWAQIDRSGNAPLAYEITNYVCLNSSWKEHFWGELRKLCRHAIDGIFLDGPIMRQDCCYCMACQADYRRRYGRDLFDASRAEIMEYHVAVIADFLKETRKVMLEVNPKLFIYINNSALRADVTGSRTRALLESVDLLGAEGGFVWVNRGSRLWPVSPMAKMIETQAEGRPTVIFIAGDYKPWSYYMHTAPETGMYYAQSVANGSSVWYGIHGPAEQMDTPGGREAVRWNRFLHKNRALYADTRQQARIALLWSQDSANYYASSVEKTDFTSAEKIENVEKLPHGNHSDAFLGAFEILTRAHLQFVVLDEEAVEKGALDTMDTVILPTYACMRESVSEKLHAFAQSGGTVIATYDSGMYDARGKLRNASLIADLAGIRSLNGFETYTLSGSGYRRKTEEAALTNDLSWKFTPSASLVLKAVPTEEAKVYAESCAAMPSRYSELPEEWFPTVWEHPYGKGKCVYFAETLCEDYFKEANPDHRELLEAAVRLNTRSLLETNAAGSVEMVLRKAQDGFVLHLINETGEMERPIRRLLPQEHLKIELFLEKPLSQAALHTPDADTGGLRFESTATGAILYLEKLSSYAAIALR
ncbi:MAG: alpha-amylase family protein [Eubacteriales bacterium]|jgi:hypothetical protein